MNKEKLFIAGHRGLLGSAILSRLKKDGYKNIIFKTHEELDLTRQTEVENFFRAERPELVILAAAKVGGIHANIANPVEFLYNNLCIEMNVINSAFKYKINKLLFFGSACSYPRDCPQPIKEEYLLTGAIEETNEPYAIAKIAGIKLCQAYNKEYGTNFITAIPTNAYGPGDNFDLNNSHVIPALIRKIHEAKINNLSSLKIWGSGRQKREFIYVDDLADASLFLLRSYNDSIPINIGVSSEITIKDLADLIRNTVGYKGNIVLDTSKPDGVAKKMLDVSRLNSLGWKPKVSLSEGIKGTHEWFVKNYKEILTNEKKGP